MKEMENTSIRDVRHLILSSGKDETLTGYDLKDDETGELKENFDEWFNAWQNEQRLKEENPNYRPCIKMKTKTITEFKYNSNRDSGFEASIVFNDDHKKLSDNIINESSLITYIGTSMDSNGKISVIDRNGNIYSE